MSGTCKSSGATEHTKECHGQFDWLHPKTVRISPYMYERTIHEALEINKLRTITEKNKTISFTPPSFPIRLVKLDLPLLLD